MDKFFLIGIVAFSFTSCVVSKKKYVALKTELEASNAKCYEQLAKVQNDLYFNQNQVTKLNNDMILLNSSLLSKTDQVNDLKEQLADCKKLRDKQLTQVGDLTVLTQAANDNIKETYLN